MNIEMALRSALVTLSQMHVLGAESQVMAQAMELISKSIKEITEAKGGKVIEDHDGQRKDV